MCTICDEKNSNMNRNTNSAANKSLQERRYGSVSKPKIANKTAYDMKTVDELLKNFGHKASIKALAEDDEQPFTKGLAIKALLRIGNRADFMELVSDDVIIPASYTKVDISEILLGTRKEEVKEVESSVSVPLEVKEVDSISEEVTVDYLSKKYPTQKELKAYALTVGKDSFQSRKLQNRYSELIEFLKTV